MPEQEFESSVILEGSKTGGKLQFHVYLFESSVILEGSKTIEINTSECIMFESSVILEGSKTLPDKLLYRRGLRVVLF